MEPTTDTNSPDVIPDTWPGVGAQEAVSDDFRRDFAARVLLAMIDNGGSKEDKTRAAVEYVDLLILELARHREPGELD